MQTNERTALILGVSGQDGAYQPVETIDSIMHRTINVMESMRFLALDARFYNAASSESFGNTQHKPADETTEFRPRSPYAVGKAAAFLAVANYREAYGLFASSGILFNHELPLRSTRYVTQEVVRGAMDIADGKIALLELGSLDLSRDGAGRRNMSMPCSACCTTRNQQISSSQRERRTASRTS